jgi:hypothetical protein
MKVLIYRKETLYLETHIHMETKYLQILSVHHVDADPEPLN